MRLREFNEEVFFTNDEFVKVSFKEIEELKKKAICNKRRRARLCSHNKIKDKVHEMLIVHAKDAYIRPHKHLGKSESVHVVEGEAEVVIYDDKGVIRETMEVGDYKSGRKFYYRISNTLYHNLVVKSDFFIFHEVTGGPFIREDTIYAPWASEDIV
ncbi:MAG: WbuC family cupin fold metalloprotein [Candidatus Omnitrophota bacterium]